MHKDAAAAPTPNAKAIGPELITRLISGLVLALVAILTAYAGPLPFAILTLIFAVVMSWEWSRLVRDGDVDLPFVVHAAAVTAAVVLAALGQTGFALLVLLIGTAVVGAMCFDAGGRYSALGVLYAGVPAVMLTWLRSDEPYGLLAVLFLFAIVWLSDTAAFAFGRTLGGPKLWPSVSPNKTWAGFAGGLIGAFVAAVLLHLLTAGSDLTYLAVVGVALGLCAQAGDLAESALKRFVGAKDSSHLIPGHGGVMDRMDSLVAVAAAAGLLALALNMLAPARALLLGG